MTELETLSEEKCLELLRGAIIGRVGFTASDGQRIVPVNYTTVEDSIVFRTSPYSELGSHTNGQPIAFEIDHIDYADHKGWSVLATGVARFVEDVRELVSTGILWDPKPWASGSRLLYVRMPWERVTGRRIEGSWTRDNELPVRRR